jgi:hypothetical protein
MDHASRVQAMAEALSILFATDCRVLDILERRGWTSYIDFIRPGELGDEHAMKGVDAFGRRFIAFKCTVQTTSTTPPSVSRLFTTFFQRYRSDSADEVLYHTAGHYGTHLFTTVGGASLSQIEQLCKLMRSGRIDLTVDDMKQLNVGYRNHIDVQRLEPSAIDTVTLGWSEVVVPERS